MLWLGKEESDHASDVEQLNVGLISADYHAIMPLLCSIYISEQLWVVLNYNKHLSELINYPCVFSWATSCLATIYGRSAQSTSNYYQSHHTMLLNGSLYFQIHDLRIQSICQLLVIGRSTPAVGHLDPNEFQVAVRWWLGWATAVPIAWPLARPSRPSC